MAKTSKNILDEARKEIKQIDIDEARLLLDKGAKIIDVRESDEWRQGHIPQAIGIPRGFLEIRVEEKVPDRKTPVIMQCASGTRSAYASRAMRELGYENVYNLTGGFNAWKDRGLPWEADRQFTQDELTRYSRHFVIPEVGEKGQAKLLDSKVLLLGAGALGSPVALYLAAAGVGTLGLVDFDVVDLSNLQRQIIHTVDRIGIPKTESAQKQIAAMNPGIKVIRHDVRLTSENVMEIIAPYDVIVNCGDNFPTRYLINDACVFAKKPLVDGAIFRFEGNATVFYADKGGPCYRCLYPEPGAARHGAVVRGGRSARRAAGSYRIDRGARSDQAAARCRASADRQDDLLRHAVGSRLRAYPEDSQGSEHARSAARIRRRPASSTTRDSADSDQARTMAHRRMRTPHRRRRRAPRLADHAHNRKVQSGRLIKGAHFFWGRVFSWSCLFWSCGFLKARFFWSE